MYGPRPANPWPPNNSYRLLVPIPGSSQDLEQPTTQYGPTTPEPLRLSRELIRCNNELVQDSSILFQKLPCFRARFDNRDEMDSEGFRQSWIQLRSGNPDFRLHVLDDLLEISGKGQTAVIWQFIRTTGLENVQLHCLSVQTWSLCEDGKWRQAYHHIFRSPIGML